MTCHYPGAEHLAAPPAPIVPAGWSPGAAPDPSGLTTLLTWSAAVLAPGLLWIAGMVVVGSGTAAGDPGTCTTFTLGPRAGAILVLLLLGLVAVPVGMASSISVAANTPAPQRARAVAGMVGVHLGVVAMGALLLLSGTPAADRAGWWG